MTHTSRNEPVSIAIVNDFEVIVKGLRVMLADYASRVRVCETNWEDAPDANVDIALFDTFASPKSSLQRIEQMVDDRKVDRIVLYTWDLHDNFTNSALKRPVDGVISKAETGEALVEKLEQIRNGEHVAFQATDAPDPLDELTNREREVLSLAAAGEPNQAIADELFINVETVKTHMRGILRKLDVRNRTEAAAVAKELGLTQLTAPPRHDTVQEPEL